MIKSTKRAFALSLLSLVLCFTMLLGTTYAWFTDSVTSGKNTIVSGNLDVVLEYKTDRNDSWQEVTSTTTVFDENALYEPGYAEVIYFRVSNAGSLALKYNLSVDIIGENASTNVLGDEFKLSEYLKVGTYLMDEYSGEFNYADILFPFMFGSRESAINSVSGNTTKLSEATGVISTNAPVLAGEKTSQVAALVLYMPEEVGNEANYDGKVAKAPTVNLGVSLLATQYTAESDSFGSDYDTEASYPGSVETTAELKTALANGGKITLENNITLDEAITIDKPVIIDLGGHTLTTEGLTLTDDSVVSNGTVTSSKNTVMAPHIKVGGGVATFNDVEIVIAHNLNDQGGYAEYSGIEVANATAVFNNTDIKVVNDTVRKWNYAYGITANNATVVMYGGSITVDSADGTTSDYNTAICGIGKVTVTMNEVGLTTDSAVVTMGKVTLNTTDKTITSADVRSLGGGTCTINYID